MTMDHAHTGNPAADHHSIAPHVNYKKIYVTLLVLLAISIMGPRFGIKWLTLITAFGIAIVKATMVVQNFMHLKWERKIMKWVLLMSVVIVALFWAGVSPDVSHHEGRNWNNDAAKAATARGIETPEEHMAKREESEAAGEPAAGGHEASAADNDPTLPPAGRVHGMIVPPGQEQHAAAPAPAAAPAAPASAAGFDARAAFQSSCTMCHGPGGQGNGPGAAALHPKPANFTSAAFWLGKTDAELTKAITQGGASVGRSGAMPAWGSVYNPAQVQALLAYLKTLKH